MFTKNFSFTKNFKFSQKCQFYQKGQFLSKISIFSKNVNFTKKVSFYQKFQFSQQFQFLTKIIFRAEKRPDDLRAKLVQKPKKPDTYYINPEPIKKEVMKKLKFTFHQTPEPVEPSPQIIRNISVNSQSPSFTPLTITRTVKNEQARNPNRRRFFGRSRLFVKNLGPKMIFCTTSFISF